VEQGARILFVPFNINERHGNLPFVENMDVQHAQSGIYTPSDMQFARDGIASECTPNVETVVVHDLDLAVLERYRKSGVVTHWADRRDDLYRVEYLGPKENRGRRS